MWNFHTDSHLSLESVIMVHMSSDQGRWHLWGRNNFSINIIYPEASSNWSGEFVQYCQKIGRSEFPRKSAVINNFWTQKWQKSRISPFSQSLFSDLTCVYFCSRDFYQTPNGCLPRKVFHILISYFSYTGMDRYHFLGKKCQKKTSKCHFLGLRVAGKKIFWRW